MPAATRTSLDRTMGRDGVQHVRCQFIDLIGIARGRLVPRSAVAQASRRGLAFGAFGTTLDIDDIPSDPAIGSHSGDFWAIPDPASYAPLSWVPATAHSGVRSGDTPGPSTDHREDVHVHDASLGRRFARRLGGARGGGPRRRR